MNDDLKFFGTMTLFLIIAFILLHAMTAWHEQKHKQIYEDNNCTNINITYEYFDLDHTYAKTEALCPPRYERDPRHEKLHEKQDKLWPIYYAGLFFLEVLVILYLS